MIRAWLAIALLALAGDALGAPPMARGEPLLGGVHYRVRTPRGPIHAWTSPGYDPATAATIVYVHGYRADADAAWRHHGLAEQFAASRRNALFIVPEAPSRLREPVVWPSLSALLREVRRRAPVVTPLGPVIAVGHSGAYRTLLGWLEHPDLGHVIVLDGLYGGEDQLEAWLRRDRARRLSIVAADSLPAAEVMVRRIPGAVTLEALPPPGHRPALRQARLVYLRTGLRHMKVVSSGLVLPGLLALTAAPER